MEESTNNQMLLQIENKLRKWITSSRKNEFLVSEMESQATALENECSSKKSLLQVLKDDFNYDRNDLHTFTSIQRDYEAEAYIKQLESTLEVVMNKYRQLAQDKLSTTCDELRQQFSDQLKICNSCRSTIDQKSSVINILVKMMDEFLVDGSEVTNALLEENLFLKTENATLRKIVAITEKFGIKEDNNNNIESS